MCWTGDESKQLAAQNQAKAESRQLRERAGIRLDPATDPRPPGSPQPDQVEMARAQEQIHAVVPA